jgi:NAD(P)-dependent dehydrogenase (short-subunit alcohol dehydrogenase family)
MADDFAKLFDLTDKIALVTGAGSGLGKVICEGYAYYGAKVAAVDISKENVEKTVQGIVANGGSAIPLVCDVSVTEQVKNTVEETIKKFKRIDVLVNDAGLAVRSEAENMTDDMWDKVLNVNLKGAFLFCREVGKNMIRNKKGGRIINMASIAALVGVETGNVNYEASKGGMCAMTRCLAIEWAKYNILVNAIAPSHINTPLNTKQMREKPEVKKYFLNNIPLGRIGEPIDVAGAAIFLASNAASWITGHVLVVDGGHTAR